MHSDVDCGVDLERACAGFRRSGEKVFDYFLVLKDGCRAVFVEVHPASSGGSVEELIKKKVGTQETLRRAGWPAVDGTWCWLVPGSGTVCFKASDALGKALAAKQIQQPCRTFLL